MASHAGTDRAAQLDALHRELTDKIGALATSDEWLAALTAARQFHRYSPGNQLWLAMQGAQGLVASYRTWQKIPAIDGGFCQVARGEKGLSVLAPITVVNGDREIEIGDQTDPVQVLRGFKVVKVFAQNQLVCAPDIPEPPPPQKLSGPNAHQHLWTAIVANTLEEQGWTVELEPRLVDDWNGRTNFADRAVVIKDELTPPQRLKTLIHEWAHIELDHEHRLVAREVKEIEAESVAYLTGSTVGLDTSGYSIPYVAGWSGGDVTVVRATAERVLATTQQLLDHLEHELGVDLAPDPLAQHHHSRSDAVSPIRPGAEPARLDALPPAELGTWSPVPQEPQRPTSVPASVDAHANRLLPADRELLYHNLDTSHGPLSAAMVTAAACLLADAGCGARDAADIFRHCHVADTLIVDAFTRSYSVDGAAPEPLFTNRELRAAGLSPLTAIPGGPAVAAAPAIAGGAPRTQSAARQIVDSWLSDASEPPPPRPELTHSRP